MMEKSAVVLISPCILNAQFQAAPPVTNSHWGTPFIQLLKDYDVEFFCLPCTEAGFCGMKCKKHGLDYYQSLKGYPEYCESQVQNILDRVLLLSGKGKEIIACLGVEHSPSCAVSYMYTHHGMVKRAGIFFDRLFTGMEKVDINLKWIGINRKYPQKAYTYLRTILEQWKSEC